MADEKEKKDKKKKKDSALKSFIMRVTGADKINNPLKEASEKRAKEREREEEEKKKKK